MGGRVMRRPEFNYIYFRFSYFTSTLKIICLDYDAFEMVDVLLLERVEGANVLQATTLSLFVK